MLQRKNRKIQIKQIKLFSYVFVFDYQLPCVHANLCALEIEIEIDR